VNGYCNSQGVCVCHKEWIGEHCDQKEFLCGKECSPSGKGHGTCGADGICKCEAGWQGKSCNEDSSAKCTPTCAKSGHCVNDHCECDKDYSGADCSSLPCGGECMHGTCDFALRWCVCDSGYSGATCSIFNELQCLLDCTTKCSPSKQLGQVPVKDENGDFVTTQSASGCLNECSQTFCKIDFEQLEDGSDFLAR